MTVGFRMHEQRGEERVTGTRRYAYYIVFVMWINFIPNSS